MSIPIIFLIYILLFESINFTLTHNFDDNKLEMLFRARSQTEWEDVWHHETHSRCRDQLIRHLYWACEKDIYKLPKRNQNSLESIQQNHIHIEILPWLNKNEVNRFLRTRRQMTKKGGITSECCHKSCNWEEYAEYCPSNKRRNHNRN